MTPSEAKRVTARTEEVEAQLAAIIAVSHAVSESRAIGETLERIAATAAQLAGASASAIIMRRQESATGLSVVASYGLSEQYADELNNIRPIELGRGPSGMAAQSRRAVAISDVMADPLVSPWRDLAVREHYRALVSVPLRVGKSRRVIGVLNGYRADVGEWSEEVIGLLETLADHAAIAILTAQLLDEQKRQVRGLSLIVRSLRTQGHEHSNLIHALYGLLTLGETEEALELIATSDARYEAANVTATAGIDNTVISGFLVAEVVIAGNSSIQLSIDPASHLEELPANLTDLDAITVLGNLIQNACEAVAESAGGERWVSVLISDLDNELTIRVEDNGSGIPADRAGQALSAGFSSKPDHAGIGLALVQGLVTQASGEISIDRGEQGGAVVAVRIPF